MSNFGGSDITEQVLTKLYEDFSREQMSLMTKMKDCSNDENPTRETDITKQISMLNTLMLQILRFRNLRKDIAKKANL
jgi:hypothetical protein